MKSYKLAEKVVKKAFSIASFASASSLLAQSFRVVQFLISLSERTKHDRNLAISPEAFASQSADKFLLFHHDLPSNSDTVWA